MAWKLTHAKYLERCQSGRMCSLGKRVGLNGPRRFKSCSLRQIKQPPTRWFFYLIESVIRTGFAPLGLPLAGRNPFVLTDIPLPGELLVLSATLKDTVSGVLFLLIYNLVYLTVYYFFSSMPSSKPSYI